MSTLDTQGSRSQNADSTDILKTKEAGKKGEGTSQELSNANIQTQKAIIGEEHAVLKPSIEAAKMTNHKWSQADQQAASQQTKL